MSTAYDGDYTSPQIAGPIEYEIPFKTDPKRYSYKVPYWQFDANFNPLSIGDPGPFGGYYVGDSSPKSIGGGVIEYQSEFALVPDTRSEPESFVYSYQIILVGAEGGITEMPVSVNSRLQFDYFLTNTPSEIELPKAGRAFQVASVIYMLNGFCDTVLNGTTGEEILAQDATYKIWKPGIYERQMRFVPWISIEDLFANSGCGA